MLLETIRDGSPEQKAEASRLLVLTRMNDEMARCLYLIEAAGKA